MDCKIFETKLIAYMDGELSESLAHDMHQHIISCSKCKEMYDFVSMGYQTIQNEKNIQIKPFLYTRIQGRQQSRTPSIFKPVSIPALAGVLVMGLVFGFIVSTISFAPQQNKNQEYELAYLFNEMQFENVESKLLSD